MYPDIISSCAPADMSYIVLSWQSDVPLTELLTEPVCHPTKSIVEWSEVELRPTE